jgi:dTDP-4-dehydrorhamnose 3,5-epimerase-like enzyme
MKYERNLQLPDVIEIQPEVFYDFRGEYIETWNKKYYEQQFSQISIRLW